MSNKCKKGLINHYENSLKPQRDIKTHLSDKKIIVILIVPNIDQDEEESELSLPKKDVRDHFWKQSDNA